jgi:hypothetical protein
MEERIEARVPPEKVWASWERAHATHSEGVAQPKIVEGQKGVSKALNMKGFRYQLLDVVPGKQFSILWKTLFVRLLFSHSVSPARSGSEIRYSVHIKGPFAWPVRWFLGKKIRQNICLVLKAIVKQLEEESIVETRHRRSP